LTDQERIAVRALQDKKAQNIILILLGNSADWARSLVICDAPVEVHRRALRDAVEEALTEAGLWRPEVCHCEVTESWILMDLGETIINIFSTQARHYYDLERTWGEKNNIFRF
jgi:ribosome-associated protein